jgi:hypothetical protein
MMRRKIFFSSRTVGFGIAVLACSALFALENEDMEAEAARVKKEITRIQSERAKVREETARDAAEFSEYRQRSGAQRAALAAENDSVRAQTALAGRQSDSLGAMLSELEAEKREIVHRQKSLGDGLASICDRLVSFCDTLPPSVSVQSAAALTFLKSEITSGTVDNIEAVHRLLTVCDDIGKQLLDIQVLQGPSPVAQIRGTCSRIRIGGVFEAVVDAGEQKCAIWSGGAPDAWQVIDDAGTASRILGAVNVREGKQLPDLVELPFGGVSAGEAE